MNNLIIKVLPGDRTRQENTQIMQGINSLNKEMSFSDIFNVAYYGGEFEVINKNYMKVEEVILTFDSLKVDWYLIRRV